MKKLIFIIISLLIANFSVADEQRMQTTFKSKNEKFTLQYSKNRWKLKDEKGKTLYSMKDKGYTSMTISISDDGRRVVIVDDFVEGRNIGQRAGISFFNNGTLTNSYKIANLLSDTCNIAISVWHTMWALGDFGFIKSDSIFSMATFELNEIEFDTYNGKIVKNKKAEPFDETALIVIGEFYKGGGEQCKMKIRRYIIGTKQENDTIIFKTKYYGIGLWKQLLMIKNHEDVTPIRFRDIRINRCF